MKLKVGRPKSEVSIHQSDSYRINNYKLMKKQIIFILLLISSLTYSSCNKEEETTDQTGVYNLTFKAEHHGARFKGHYRFLITDSKDNFKYDKQDYVQNTSISMTTEAKKGDKVYIYAENPIGGDTCIVSCKSSDGSISMKVFTTGTASDSLVL